MKDVVLNEVKGIARKLNKKESVVKIMFYILMQEGFNEKESVELIQEFYKDTTCPKLVQQNRKI